MDTARASHVHLWHCFTVGLWSLWCWHITREAPLFGVGTQLGECRYKFLRRWNQYGSHRGPRLGDKSISDWFTQSISPELLFHSAPVLFSISTSVNWRKVMSHWVSVTVIFPWHSSNAFVAWALITVHWGDHERECKLQYFCVCPRLVTQRRQKGQHNPLLLEYV